MAVFLCSLWRVCLPEVAFMTSSPARWPSLQRLHRVSSHLLTPMNTEYIIDNHLLNWRFSDFSLLNILSTLIVPGKDHLAARTGNQSFFEQMWGFIWRTEEYTFKAGQHILSGTQGKGPLMGKSWHPALSCAPSSCHSVLLPSSQHVHLQLLCLSGFLFLFLFICRERRWRQNFSM